MSLDILPNINFKSKKSIINSTTKFLDIVLKKFGCILNRKKFQKIIKFESSSKRKDGVNYTIIKILDDIITK